ncbi:MAG: hypothetical protein N4A65_04770 [Cohaesibacter sp.]|jgi:hypothetical protein|nr:hypothetical protein [Cohaesibacter sp.]
MKKPDQPIYDILQPWTWPLPFDHDVAVDLFLDDFMGRNPLATNEERRNFVSKLRSSLSLNATEKQTVLRSFREFSQFQIDELLKVFEEEQVKFLDLQTQHPEDVVVLHAVMDFEWSLIIDPRYGPLTFLTKFVFPENSVFSSKDIRHAFGKMSGLLVRDDHHASHLELIRYLFENTKKMLARDREYLINAGFYSLARSGLARSSNEMMAHPIGQQVSKLSQKKYGRSRAFLEFCAVSYPMDLYGLKDEAQEVEEQLYGSYRRAGFRNSDLSSQLSTYNLLIGDFPKAMKAAEICLKRYDKAFALSPKALMQLAEHKEQFIDLGSNVLRNYMRFFCVLMAFRSPRLEALQSAFVDEYFKPLLEPLKAWRYDRLIANLFGLIPIYYFAKGEDLQKNAQVAKYLNDNPKEEDKFLFRLAFSRSLRGGELDGLKEAMMSISGKTDLFYFCLIVQAISLSRIHLREDRDFVRKTVKKTYKKVIKQKGWYRNKELALFGEPIEI